MFTSSMKFDLGEDVNSLREMVHRWAQDKVKPLAASIRARAATPADITAGAARSITGVRGVSRLAACGWIER